MLLMHANNREDIKEARAGDIVALAGLKSTTTGDTLCDPDNPVILERMEFPDPVIEVAVEPKSKADQEKMGEALGRLVAGGSVLPRLDRPGDGPDRHQGHGRAPSRDHRRPPEAATTRSTPMSARRRSPIARRSAASREIDYTHKKQTGGSGQFARIKLVFEPGAPGSGFSSRARSSAARCRRNSSPASRRASTASRETGVLAGFPVIDFKATLIDGAYHDVDFERAGVRDRRPRGVPRRPRQGAVQAARADHEGRGGDARGLHGRLHRRPEQPPRPDPRHGCRAATRRSSMPWCRWPTCSAT